MIVGSDWLVIVFFMDILCLVGSLINFIFIVIIVKVGEVVIGVFEFEVIKVDVY